MKRKKPNTKEFDEVKESWALQVGIRACGEHLKNTQPIKKKTCERSKVAFLTFIPRMPHGTVGILKGHNTISPVPTPAPHITAVEDTCFFSISVAFMAHKTRHKQLLIHFGNEIIFVIRQTLLLTGLKHLIYCPT